MGAEGESGAAAHLEGDKIFFKLLNEEHPWFSLKLVYEGDVLRQAVLDGERIVG